MPDADDDGQPFDPATMAVILDGTLGAFERAQLGRIQAQDGSRRPLR